MYGIPGFSYQEQNKDHLCEIMQNNKYIKQTKETSYIRCYKLHGTNRIKYVTIMKGNYLNHRNVKFCA